MKGSAERNRGRQPARERNNTALMDGMDPERRKVYLDVKQNPISFPMCSSVCVCV